jgi:hypothetical protein
MPVALSKIAKGEVGQTTVTANHQRSAFSSSVIFPVLLIASWFGSI